MAESPPAHLLLWLDLEMTGLDPADDEIIEIAAIVTDNNLEIRDELAGIVISQPESRFEQMDDWNREHHSKSGLWAKVIESRTTIAAAEDKVLDFLSKHDHKQPWILCGNSIWQDRRFILKYMPKLEKQLHYRMIDVSTMKELVRRWAPQHLYEKDSSHRALDDIRESINEAKHYRDNIFKLDRG